MTDATIIENNTTKHEELRSGAQNCTGEKVCNQTQVSGNINQSQATNNTYNDITNITSNVTKENQNTSIVVNQNTLLKYVYKNNDKIGPDTKNKGHIKNSLKRRKRSIEDPLSPLPSKFQKPALIVDYETSHGPAATASWSPPINSANAIKNDERAGFKITTHHPNTQENNEKDSDKLSNLDSREAANLNDGSNESTEKLDAHNKKVTSRENDESYELNNYKKEKESPYNQNHADNYQDGTRKNDDSNESTENHRIKSDSGSVESSESVEKNGKNYYASSEQSADKNRESSSFNQSPHSSEHSKDRDRKNEDYKSYNSSIEESSENSNESSNESINESSKERNDYTSKPHNSKLFDNKENSLRTSQESLQLNSREHDRYSEPYTHHQEKSKPSHSRDDQESSIENSSESNIKDTNYPKNKINFKNDVSNPIHSPSLPIQDIDLGDFSYEKINVNQDGKVVAVEDSSEGNNANPVVQNISPKVNANSPKTLQLVKNTPLANYSDKLVNINDGEIKPVVEINSEDDEDSDEKSNKSSFDSLETGLNSKDDGSGKILNAQNTNEGDVKQQFERIPLNYNHNQKVKTDDNTNPPKGEYPPNSQDLPNKKETVVKSEGTIDVFAPNDEKYDENLNLKFSDLNIKLPEIVLPEDILSYTQSYSPFKDEINEEDKGERYHYPRYTEPHSKSKKYRDDDSDTDEQDGPVSDYYGYYNSKDDKQDYKKKADEEEESDEEEDLYEKFVRERFGKRGTFEKRSEKLVEPPLNPELRKTIQKILKNTAKLDEPIKESGDPNAKYMWTLEYGETL